MIHVNNDNNYTSLKWITPTMQNFVNSLSFNYILYSVGLVPAGYYATPKDHINELFDEKLLTLVINAKINKNIYEHDFNHLSSLLQITQGSHNNTINPIFINEVNDYKTIRMTNYICKKKGFDDALKALQFMDDTFTENDLIYLGGDNGPNYSFVYDSNVSCDDVIVEHTYNKNIKNHICNMFSLTIIATDIEKNKDIIFDILTLVNTMIFN